MLTENQMKALDQTAIWRSQIAELDRSKKLGIMNETEYQIELQHLVPQIDKLLEEWEAKDRRRMFDELMGHPLEHLEKLWGLTNEI